MIRLLTGQPGNGKTSHLINLIRQALAEGRIVYTVGIPKLKLPVIELNRSQIALWHQRVEVLPPEKIKVAKLYAPSKQTDYFDLLKEKQIECSQKFIDAEHISDDVEPITVLTNIAEGALIIVDEAQKGFEPTGVNVPEHIKYLTEHRHHGLDFIFVTQYPFLVHKVVQALVTTHWHIRYTWKGRKIHEWPDWQENPKSASSLETATTSSYSIDESTFKEYESASIHTVVKHKRPFYVYFIMASFLAVPILGYTFVNRMYQKTQVKQFEAKQEKAKNESNIKPSNNNFTVNQPVNEVPQIDVKPAYENVQVVSNQYDWSSIAACVKMRDKCQCYGDGGNKLVIPKPVCESAVDSGWSGRSSNTVINPPLPVPIDSTNNNLVDSARNVDTNFTNSQGMGSRASPNNASQS